MQFDYYFNNLGHMDADPIDSTQRSIQNSKIMDYSISNYLSNTTTDSHVNFAISQPTMTFSGTATGRGLNGDIVDIDSQLTIKTTEERPLDKVQLFQRAYLSVPYLGRGSCDPTLELKLLQGQNVSDMKSVSTIMDKSFMGYTMYPTDSEMDKRMKNTTEESALSGWVHGGQNTRITSDNPTATTGQRPTNRGF
jgi:hypothetical protein